MANNSAMTIAWNVIACVEVQVHTVTYFKPLQHMLFIIMMLHHDIHDALTYLHIISACEGLSKGLLHELPWSAQIHSIHQLVRHLVCRSIPRTI